MQTHTDVESTKENIECTDKNGQIKFFSSKQLEHIGQSANGSYDGWTPTAPKPAGIPDKVVIGGNKPDSNGYDPNGGTTVEYTQSGDGNPNGASTTGDATGAQNSTDTGTDAGKGAANAQTTTTDPNAVNGNGDAGDAGKSDAKEGADSGDAGTGDAADSLEAKGDGEGDSKEGTETGNGTEGTGDAKPAEKVVKTANKPGPKPKADKPGDTPKE